MAGAFLRLYLVGETGAHYRGGVTIYRDEQNCKTSGCKTGAWIWWPGTVLQGSVATVLA